MGWQGNEISVSRCSFSGLFVGADACIGPLGSCEFAVDYRKNGLYCRADATPADWFRGATAHRAALSAEDGHRPLQEVAVSRRSDHLSVF